MSPDLEERPRSRPVLVLSSAQKSLLVFMRAGGLVECRWPGFDLRFNGQPAPPPLSDCAGDVIAALIGKELALWGPWQTIPGGIRTRGLALTEKGRRYGA